MIKEDCNRKFKFLVVNCLLYQQWKYIVGMVVVELFFADNNCDSFRLSARFPALRAPVVTI